MSVFDDFQRMWLMRFPNNSLSSEWEDDVKASLNRHKLKIVELTKELEQEMLYVEYLERLLGDVEKYKSEGGDATAFTKSSAALAQMTTTTTINSDLDRDEDKANADAVGGGGSSSVSTNDGHNEVVLRTPEKAKITINETEVNDSDYDYSLAAIKSRVEKMNCTPEQGALHHQCIDELSSHITSAQVENGVDKNSVVTTTSTPSSFVTVIEVKESTPITVKPAASAAGATLTAAGEDSVTFAEESPAKSMPSTPEVGNRSNKSEDSFTASTVHLDVRRKVPPRPPPKNLLRRIGPQVESPTFMTESPPSPSATMAAGNSATTLINKNENASSSSLDSNIRPSDILRHKYNDEKLTTVLHKFSSSNIAKSGSTSSAESLINSTNNDEVNNAETYPISERIKSYESISSLSSDGLKVGTIGSSGGGSGTGGGSVHLDNADADAEPYYDTVPVEDNDADTIGAYVNSAKNVSSSLPKMFDRQISADVGGQVGERSSNYINIDYFLSQNRKLRDSSNESDDELEQSRSTIDGTKNVLPSKIKAALESGISRNKPIRHIITSIITSESFYVECLNKMMQYMKAIRATLTTSRPVISEKEFQTMFFKIDDLYVVHITFLSSLQEKIAKDSPDIHIGGPFEELAKHIHIYGAFLHNYGQAIDTVKKCGENNVQFKEIVSKIVLNSQNEQLLTLEDLLHKPVARLQKNALVLQDLINETPSTHPDYKPLTHAQKIIHKLLSEFNVVQSKSGVDDKALRRLVKNSFIVELADGHRKLRHLFLFNDVIACAKYKASGRDRFEFELKWFISLKDVFVPPDDGASGHNTLALSGSSLITLTAGTIPTGNDAKETNPVNLLSLKSQASTVRDLILAEEQEKKSKSYGSRSMDKYRKKLHDIEAQLVLASPNLLFRIGNKTTNKICTFFLSSQFERSHWIDTINELQESCNLPSAQQVNLYDLQAWIAACQAFIKTEMGSYLMRNSRDESLLVGDVHLTIQSITGMDKPANLYIAIEVDSYGHYFRKSATKILSEVVNPQWNEFFLLELEGCQNIRFLLYEDVDNTNERPVVRAEHVLKLSRKWLEDQPLAKSLKMSDTITLNITIKFCGEELLICRVPTTKPGPLFAVKFQQILKREKRDIPFIMTSCIREVERRGMQEVGIYRVSGSASDLARLKKAFESNNYEAEQLLKEVDIHSVTGIFKSFLRELPETLFTDTLYRKFIETFNKFSNINENELSVALQAIFTEIPAQNRISICFILDHLLKIHQNESENKMSLHNLAMVFGPTLLRPAQNSSKQKDQLETSTVDVMAQAGILYCFLQSRKK